MNIESSSSKKIPVLIFSFVVIAYFTMNLYLPSLPSIAMYFHVSVHTAESTLSIYLISFGLSQLIYGPVSDYIGRRKVLLIGILIVLLGNILATVSHSITMLIISRVIQGLGSGSLMVLMRTIIRDCFSGKSLAKTLSGLAMIISISPAIAPFIGGHLHSLFGWRANFLALSIYTALIWLLLYFALPETIKHRLQGPISSAYILRNFYYTLKCRVFVMYTLCLTLVFAFNVIYLVATPFIYQQQLGTSAEEYGTLMMIPAAGYFLGSSLSLRLTKWLPITSIILLGIFIVSIDSIALLICASLNIITVFSLTSMLFFILFGSGCLYSNCLAGTMAPFSEIAGTAAATSGTIQMLAAAIFSGSIEFFHLSTPIGLGIYFLSISLVLAFIFIGYIFPQRHQENINEQVSR